MSFSAVLDNDKEAVLAELQRVRGVGPAAAAELARYGYKKATELVNARELPIATRACAKYVDELSIRIPRDVTSNLLKKVQSATEKYLALDKTSIQNIEGVGSYRRGASTSGDIDMLICLKNEDDPPCESTVSTFVSAMDKTLLTVKRNQFITADENIVKVEDLDKSYVVLIALGTNFAHMLIEINDKMCVMEMYFAKPSTYGAALLHYTGSARFNIAMSNRAKYTFGYKLSVLGLFDKINKIGGESEEELFTLLEMSYIKPEHRDDTTNMKQIMKDAIRDFKS